MEFVVAIDGPAGAGKSTVARRLAAALGWSFLDTGAIYRAVTLLALEHRIAPEDGTRLGALARTADVRQDETGRTFIGTRDVSTAIRNEAVTAAVSAVSAHPEVRAALIGIQRRAADAGPLVCEGRDMGTVVFPDAALKLFLDADVPTRAIRRHTELAAGGNATPLSEIERRIAERDAKDSSRATAPLRRTDDQIYLDTSRLPLEEVIVTVRGLVAERLRHRHASTRGEGRSSGGGAPPAGRPGVPEHGA